MTDGAVREPGSGATATRILVVEDDRLVLAGLVSGLEAHGYTVIRAISGEQAVSLASQAQPDLVLMDVGLPGIAGTEAARRILKTREVPIVFLSALDAQAVVREAIALGGFSYLVKPISIKQLVPAIESALERARDLAKLKSSEESLAGALMQSREISVAIGRLMERHGASAEEAFELLRAHARSTRRKAHDVAQDVISGALQLAPPGATQR